MKRMIVQIMSIFFLLIFFSHLIQAQSKQRVILQEVDFDSARTNHRGVTHPFWFGSGDTTFVLIYKDSIVIMNKNKRARTVVDSAGTRKDTLSFLSEVRYLISQVGASSLPWGTNVRILESGGKLCFQTFVAAHTAMWKIIDSSKHSAYCYSYKDPSPPSDNQKVVLNGVLVVPPYSIPHTPLLASDTCIIQARIGGSHGLIGYCPYLHIETSPGSGIYYTIYSPVTIWETSLQFWVHDAYSGIWNWKNIDNFADSRYVCDATPTNASYGPGTSHDHFNMAAPAYTALDNGYAGYPGTFWDYGKLPGDTMSWRVISYFRYQQPFGEVYQFFPQGNLSMTVEDNNVNATFEMWAPNNKTLIPDAWTTRATMDSLGYWDFKQPVTFENGIIANKIEAGVIQADSTLKVGWRLSPLPKPVLNASVGSSNGLTGKVYWKLSGSDSTGRIAASSDTISLTLANQKGNLSWVADSAAQAYAIFRSTDAVHWDMIWMFDHGQHNYSDSGQTPIRWNMNPDSIAVTQGKRGVLWMLDTQSKWVKITVDPSTDLKDSTEIHFPAAPGTLSTQKQLDTLRGFQIPGDTTRYHYVFADTGVTLIGHHDTLWVKSKLRKQNSFPFSQVKDSTNITTTVNKDTLTIIAKGVYLVGSSTFHYIVPDTNVSLSISAGGDTLKIKGSVGAGALNSSFMISPADRPPTSPSTYDDEFNLGNGTTPDTTTKWSWWKGTRRLGNSLSALDYWGKLYVIDTGLTSSSWRMLGQNLAAGDSASFTITAKINIRAIATTSKDVAIWIGDNATGKFQEWGYLAYNTGIAFQWNYWTAPGTFSSTPYVSGTFANIYPVYFRLRKVSTAPKSIFAEWSFDGLVWWIYAGSKPAFEWTAKTTTIGVAWYNSINGERMEGEFEWFRVNWTPDFDPTINR